MLLAPAGWLVRNEWILQAILLRIQADFQTKEQ